MSTVASHRRPRSARSRAGWLGGALAGVVAVGLVGVPGALAQSSPTVAATAATPTVEAKQRAQIKVAAKSAAGPLRFADVALQRWTGKAWTTVGHTRTRSTGTADAFLWPTATTTWRVVAGGTASVAVRVTVRPPSGARVVAEAARHVGAPYRFGAAGPSAFDCSGFTAYVYGRFGKSLPHSATGQARYGAAVSKAAARPGDLILIGSAGSYSHAAVFAGSGYMYDAPTTGQTVAKRKIWSSSYVVRRLV